MRQRVHHSAKATTRPCRCSATMKGCLTALSFVLLVCGIGANPCQPEQIHWKNTSGNRYKCLECPKCFARLQPSVACGTSVKYGTPVDCVSCELGKTYSDQNDKAQCKPCTICSKGKAVLSNCTFSTNTICDNKCGQGFYNVPLISDCLACTQCCGDEKDELAEQCANSNKKCKMRSAAPCLRVHTTPSSPPEQLYTLNTSSTAQTTSSIQNDITTTQVNALDKSASESGKQDGIGVTNLIVILMSMLALALCLLLSANLIRERVRRNSREQSSFNSGDNAIAQRRLTTRPFTSLLSFFRQESPSAPSNQSELLEVNGTASSQPDGPISPQPIGRESVLPQSITPALHEPVSPRLNESALLKPDGSASAQPNGRELPQATETATSQAKAKATGSAAPQANASTVSQGNGSAFNQSKVAVTAQPKESELVQCTCNGSAPERGKANPGDVTLEELEENHFSVFEQMCKELNSRIPGERWDFERLASCYEEITTTDRKCLKNEFHNGGGSPSDVLMSHIKAKYPDHPLRCLVRNLRIIGRNDLARTLIPYIAQKPSST